jgi:PAS domain S-box-containing protein
MTDKALESLKNEHNISLSHDDYKNFFTFIDDAFIIGSTSGYFLDVNDRFCNNLGYNREEMVGKQFYNFIHPDDIE